MSVDPHTQLRDTALFTLIYGTGLRISEALGVDCRDAPASGQTRPLRVRGKGGKERLVPVLPDVRRAVSAWLRAHPAPLPDGPLFVGARGGRLNAGVAQRVMRHYRQAHGIPDHATPHALRHSFATSFGWRVAPICAPFRTCWDMQAFPPRSATPRWMRPHCCGYGRMHIHGRGVTRDAASGDPYRCIVVAAGRTRRLRRPALRREPLGRAVVVTAATAIMATI